MFNEKMTYGYNDICIQPEVISKIKHRSECNTLKDGMLPIFTAPMSSVINEKNYEKFESNSIIPIIPRNVEWNVREKLMSEGKWVACSLKEFNYIIEYYTSFQTPAHILIDVANGHMEEIFTLSKKAKTKFGKDNIILMSGNIANPKAYYQYCLAGIDYVRCSIGSGQGCITASNTAIHYGIVNLLNETYQYKRNVESVIKENGYHHTESMCRYKCVTKIIADGGIRNYSDVVKALALGADYVMVGGLLSQLVESCAKTYYNDDNGEAHVIDTLDESNTITENNGEFYITRKEEGVVVPNLYKVFYGMASKLGQKDLFGEKKKTAEGTVKYLKCTTNINKWADNMKDYLASAMSYCNIEDVNDFNQENIETYLMSNNLQNSINK